jgi:translocation and assembly module TamA
VSCYSILEGKNGCKRGAKKKQMVKDFFRGVQVSTSSWGPYLFFCLLLGTPYWSHHVEPGPCFADQGISYNISIEGISDQEILKLLRQVSQAFVLKKRLPATMNLLRRRVHQDVPLLIKTLRSRGYYDARIETSIDKERQPVEVVFRIDTGPPYLLKEVEITLIDPFSGDDFTTPRPEEIGLVIGHRIRHKDILDAEQRLLQWFKRHGYPLVKREKREVVVDHASQTFAITFFIKIGPIARFGPTWLKGLVSVREDFVMGKLPWKEGDIFNGDHLERLRKALMATGLFANVKVNTSKELDLKGYLPIVVDVKESVPRTVKLGGSFKTDEGPGGKISWEHRNFFGRGERLTLKGSASGIDYAADARLRKPDFYRADQALILGLRLAEDKPDAYTSRNISTLFQIERVLRRGMDIRGGVAFRISDIEQLGDEDRFRLLFFPLGFDWDTSDHLLDPSRGGRLNLEFIPFHDFYGEDLDFFKHLLQYSRYLALSRKPSIVFAARATLGFMYGADRDDIPADVRFYAGGGGSIRGYAYQSVGPIEENTPIGGRSQLTFSAECRFKSSERIGFVVFVDGGSAFESVFPDFEETIRWGAGAGFRYFTPIGPLRLDVGIPLNRRDDFDDAFQVYVSLGQAF